MTPARNKRGSISAEAHLHTVQVRVTKDVLDRDAPQELYLVSVEEAFRIAGNFITAAKSALQRQLWDAQCGECKVCKNERFVAGPRGQRIHCKCVEKSRHPIPAMTGWAEDEAEVR